MSEPYPFKASDIRVGGVHRMDIVLPIAAHPYPVKEDLVLADVYGVFNEDGSEGFGQRLAREMALGPAMCEALAPHQRDGETALDTLKRILESARGLR